MQEFFMDYGLWLLIGLLVVIGIIFLLSGKRDKGADQPTEHSESPISPPAAVASAPVETMVEAAPEPVLAAEPAPEPAAPIAQEPAPEPALVPAPMPVEAAIPAAPEPAAAPEPIPASPAIAAAPATGTDDLLKLKGVGPKLGMLLTELGVTRYAQIAGWNDGDIAAIDARLGNFRGRPVRDQWVDQAKYLAAGDIAGFEAKYGKI